MLIERLVWSYWDIAIYIVWTHEIEMKWMDWSVSEISQQSPGSHHHHPHTEPGSVLHQALYSVFCFGMGLLRFHSSRLSHRCCLWHDVTRLSHSQGSNSFLERSQSAFWWESLKRSDFSKVNQDEQPCSASTDNQDMPVTEWLQDASDCRVPVGSEKKVLSVNEVRLVHGALKSNSQN